MIEHALALLEMTEPPSWEKDAPLRRELERLREDVHAYNVCAGYDDRRARIKAAQVAERADRIDAFLANRRFGGQAANGYGFRRGIA